jgi:hypothetical protein
MSPQKCFITFGGPAINYHNAVNRICSEARAINVFDNNIIGYTEKDLINDDEFWKKHQAFISSSEKGYGYWLWKSYLTKKTLSEMNNDDILVYADSGCVINPNGINKLFEYFNTINNSKYGILSFKTPHLEKIWSKMDIFDYYDVRKSEFLDSGQLVGGIFIIRRCEHTINIVNKWYEGCCNYHLIDDSQSNITNDESFIENRHDQSIFSIIRKKYGTEMTETDETYFDPDWNTSGYDFPFWAKRLRE